MQIHNLILISGLALLASCSQKPTNQVLLKGTTDLADGEMIFIGYMNDNQQQIDTIKVNHGAFEYTKPLQRVLRVTLFNGDFTMNNKKMRQIFLEPGEMTIVLNGEDYSTAPVQGSLVTQQMDEVEGNAKAMYAQYQSFADSLAACQDNPELCKVISQTMDSLRQEIPNSYKNWIKNNPDAIYGATLAGYIQGDMSLEELKEMYNAWTPEVQSYAESVKAGIDALEAIQPGMPAPDIIALNQNGEEIKLSDLKGNVVLLDFWATWCGPCRASFPHINSLYAKYKDKGFKVFMVADDDSDPDKWREFIVNDNVGDYSHVLRGLKIEKDENGNFKGYDKSNDNSEKYAVHYLPTKFLIDADGNIIGKVNDEELDAKLLEIYGE